MKMNLSPRAATPSTDRKGGGGIFPLLFFLHLALGASAQERSRVWSPDQGDGTYVNPVLYADYSDPDVCAVGEDYYLTASSFHAVPGLPVLHSRDLVNWRIVGHALPELLPREVFDLPAHGKGVWAPAIRHHKGMFYIYWGDPDRGIFMVRAAKAEGPWEEPVCVVSGSGMIDPCPLWDADGRCYLVNAWAASRAGFNSVLTVRELSPDGTKVVVGPRIVFDGGQENHTTEGPKFYLRDGYYWILCPAGGVEQGWQLAMRSRSPWGPYEWRRVMQQGRTSINGPHQGGWVHTPSGEDWFMHFTDRGAYGRVVCLQPVDWTSGWPVMGNQGEPYSRYRKPKSSATEVVNPQESDDFNGTPGPQWQWQANYNPSYGMPTAEGTMRLYTQEVKGNLWLAPHLFLQKPTGPSFTATARLRFSAKEEGQWGGLIMMGRSYGAIVVSRQGDSFVVRQLTCTDADQGASETFTDLATLPPTACDTIPYAPAIHLDIFLRMEVKEGRCRFAYSQDGRTFHHAPQTFTMTGGRWVGAKYGFVAACPALKASRGWMDVEEVTVASVSTLAQSSLAHYQMAGPFAVVARDGQYRASKGGSERDMKAAWDCALQGHHAKAVEIINAYAATLQRFDGHDAPLCLIQAYWLCRAMMAEKKFATPAWEDMLRRVVVPTMDKFEADSPYANGNWGAIVNRCRMAAALAMGDTAMYQAAVAYYLHAYDNGALPHYVSPTGQCQETGRDQGHAQLGLGALCDICEMAWEQGTDLWGALDNRLMKGLEYSARYNLGYDVPFETWTDCSGLYNDWTEPGAMGRGVIRTIYDAPYSHYVGKRGLKMPYVKQLLALQKQAEKRGEVKQNPEANSWQAPGVTEGKKLHQVFTYPAPQGAPLKHDYEVFVQPRGAKEWTRIDTYMAKVNAPVGDNKHQVSEISYCMFDFTGDALVRVVAKTKKFQTARIRPDYRGTIANVQNDSTVQFLLFQPENLSVEFDGNITDNLLLFTSRPPVSREQAEQEAKSQGRSFAYYAPGYYDQDDSIAVHSNTTVYIEGGAYFTGTFSIDNAHDVSILGRGIARPEKGYEGCRVRRSRHVVIDGLVVNTCPVGGSDDVTLHDVRSISFPGWGDGLNVFASSNVLYDRVFCRNSDDCTTAYATRKGFEGSARNIVMRNSTLWADVAHPIFIGLHGAAAGPHPERTDTVENLRYENIDIICQSEPQVDYQGCLAINSGDNNLVRNILFDNIRIEQLHQGSILHVKVAFNSKYCAAPGMGVENVTFRNVRYTGAQPYLSIINGYDSQRGVRGITFEGLKINGRKLYDDMPGKPSWYKTADYVPIFIGNHVEGVTFKE